MSLKKRSRMVAALLAAALVVPVNAQAAPKKNRVTEEIITGNNGELEIETENIQEETKKETETETEKSTEGKQSSVVEEVISEHSATPKTNEELVAGQQIIVPPTAQKSFRFTTVEKEYAVSRKKLYFFEEKEEKGKKVGVIRGKAILYLLSEEEDGWYYAESGMARGFVQAKDLYTGQKAKKLTKKVKVRKAGKGTALVHPDENEAFTYTQTTAETTVIEKEYAIARRDLEIVDSLPNTEDKKDRIEKTEEAEEINETETTSSEETEEVQETEATSSEETEETQETESSEEEAEEVESEEENEPLEVEQNEPKVVGTLKKDGVCYILSDTEERAWLYVESGDVRGFVQKSALRRGKKAASIIKEKGDDIVLAEEEIAPEDNKACYYTLTSTEEASVSDSIRSSMITFAQQFIGNPYVWGGTSLTNGADCSGFVQSIYREFGYSLPRVAEDQAQVGMKIPVENAEPGDLIFYARNGYIYHVVMSMGGNKTIEAQSSATGIVYGTVNQANAVWATRLISEDDKAVLEQIEENGQKAEEEVTYESAETYRYGEKLGMFKLTSYCSCPICCGIWSGGPTASGVMPSAGRTVAMGGVPFGTKLIINGNVYVVEDRGTPYGHVDIYMNSHDSALQFGLQYADVYLAE